LPESPGSRRCRAIVRGRLLFRCPAIRNLPKMAGAHLQISSHFGSERSWAEVSAAKSLREARASTARPFTSVAPGAQSARTVLRRSVLHGRNTATYGVAYKILISFALQNRAKRVNEALCNPVGHIRDSAILNGATVCENHECSGESSPRQIAGDRRGCSNGPSGIGRTV
jgi:hypothetical protein